MNNINIEIKEKRANVFVDDMQMGIISFKTNPLHNNNCYLELQFNHFDLNISRYLFNVLRKDIKAPLQIMISSTNKEVISFINVAGFVCKRKCYEIDATSKDYAGRTIDYPLSYTEEGENIYAQCCDIMLERYVLTHQDISPWTGSKVDFCKKLPKTLYYDANNGEIKNFAFVENNEIAYVYGTDIDEFGIFAEGLLTKLFDKFGCVTFEADNCDEYAMKLKSFFVHQSGESYDTYIL